MNFMTLADSVLIVDDHLDLIPIADTPAEALALIRSDD